jgi:hypothetical protein
MMMGTDSGNRTLLNTWMGCARMRPFVTCPYSALDMHTARLCIQTDTMAASSALQNKKKNKLSKKSHFNALFREYIMAQKTTISPNNSLQNSSVLMDFPE